VVVLGERHLRRMLYEYVEYSHEDRCHLGLEKDCPVISCPAPPPRRRRALSLRVAGNCLIPVPRISRSRLRQAISHAHPRTSGDSSSSGIRTLGG
jgi:hypothetical protein